MNWSSAVTVKLNGAFAVAVPGAETEKWVAAAEPTVVAAGARVHHHQPSKDGSFRVYLDPVGHPFCLIGS